MKIENSFRIELPVSKAWETLLDVPAIVGCMPGAELLAVEDERSYRGQLKAKLGPVAVTFKGRARLTEVDEAQRHVRASASGNEEKGRGSAQADVIFRLLPDGTGTRVDITTNLMLAGAVAQYGRAQGMIADVAQVIIDQFARNLGSHISAQPSNSADGAADLRSPAQLQVRAPAPAISVFSVIAALLRRWFARLLGKHRS